jgi:hypothetical protein
MEDRRRQADARHVSRRYKAYMSNGPKTHRTVATHIHVEMGTSTGSRRARRRDGRPQTAAGRYYDPASSTDSAGRGGSEGGDEPGSAGSTTDGGGGGDGRPGERGGGSQGGKGKQGKQPPQQPGGKPGKGSGGRTQQQTYFEKLSFTSCEPALKRRFYVVNNHHSKTQVQFISAEGGDRKAAQARLRGRAHVAKGTATRGGGWGGVTRRRCPGGMREGLRENAWLLLPL